MTNEKPLQFYAGIYDKLGGCITVLKRVCRV